MHQQMQKTTLFCSLLLFILFSTDICAKDDLLSVYRQALISDPLLREADANRLATGERKTQAKSLMLPQISASAGLGDRSTDGSQVGFIDTDNDPTTPPIIGNQNFSTGSDSKNWQFDISQSLFNWDHWVGLDRAEKQIEKAEIDFNISQQDLVARVTNRYFAVLAAQDVLRFEKASKEAINRQLEQTNTRFEVGLVAITDVQESQAAYDQAIASEINAMRQLALAKDNLREIVGVELEALAEPQSDFPLALPTPNDDQVWVDQAIQNNLNLLSTRMAAEIAHDNIRSQQTGRYPTLGIRASRSGGESNSNNAFDDRNTRSTNFSLSLNVPIYSGGATTSRIRESIYQYRAAKERVERITRETERETRNAYLNVEANILRAKALKQAVKSSQTALSASEKGFEVGTRTTVDVLNARRSLLDAERNYSQSRYDYLTNLLVLKRVSGVLTEADISQINNWLD